MDRNWKTENLEATRRANKQASEERMARFEKSEAAAKERRETADGTRPAEEQATSDQPAPIE